MILVRPLQRLLAIGRRAARALRRHLATATQPAGAALVVGALADAARGRSALIAENALLRQQLIILRRSAKRSRCTPTDRALLVLPTSRVRAWRQAVLLVQPDTLLRWHRRLFRWHSRWSRRHALVETWSTGHRVARPWPPVQFLMQWGRQ